MDGGWGSFSAWSECSALFSLFKLMEDGEVSVHGVSALLVVVDQSLRCAPGNATTLNLSMVVGTVQARIIRKRRAK